ncbi:hypothetical protein ABH920_001451 [Catenulispora sp. EB89]|uniref:hypothetical protein n=1 Tax=Catenulispora sp. EB89 TaxID=3156257 RepID=UPI003515DDA5
MTLSVGYRRSQEWDVRPYDDLSNAFAFTGRQPYVLILDKVSLYVLELVTRHPRQAAAERFAATVGGRLGADEAERRFDRVLDGLSGVGLIESVEQQEAEQ